MKEAMVGKIASERDDGRIQETAGFQVKGRENRSLQGRLQLDCSMNRRRGGGRKGLGLRLARLNRARVCRKLGLRLSRVGMGFGFCGFGAFLGVVLAIAEDA